MGTTTAMPAEEHEDPKSEDKDTTDGYAVEVADSDDNRLEFKPTGSEYTTDTSDTEEAIWSEDEEVIRQIVQDMDERMKSMRESEGSDSASSTAADLIAYIQRRVVGGDIEGSANGDDSETADNAAGGGWIAGLGLGAIAEEILREVHAILLYVVTGLVLVIIVSLVLMLVCYQRSRAAETVDERSRGQLVILESDIQQEHRNLENVARNVDVAFDQLQRQLRGIDARVLLAQSGQMSRSTMTLGRRSTAGGSRSGLTTGGRAERRDSAFTAAASLLSRCLEVDDSGVEEREADDGAEVEPIYAVLKARQERREE